MSIISRSNRFLVLNIRVRTITSAIVRASEAIRVQEGLMTNDSVTVALNAKAGPDSRRNG